jgi:hypothetical protein
VVWVGLLAGIVVAQRLTAHSFEHGHWTPSGLTSATRAELLWYRLPLVSQILISVTFFICAKWLVPEKGTRSIIRAWGFFATVVAVLCSVAMSLWYIVIVFYMD